MLKVLGEVFTSARVTSSSSSSSSPSAAAARRGGPQDSGDPDDIFLPSANPNGGICLRPTRDQQNEGNGGTATRSAKCGASETGIVSLRTLILGHCGGVSEAAFEAFLEVAGGGAAPGSSSNAKGGSSHHRNGKSSSNGGTSKLVGGGGAAAGVITGGSRLELSNVRLQGCKALGDRGLAMLCAGAKERLSDLQVCGVCGVLWGGDCAEPRAGDRWRRRVRFFYPRRY